MSVIRRGLVALCFSAAILPAATAGVKIHRVDAGESVSSIAKAYYGSFEAAPVLLQFNGKTSHVIRAGEQLKIPYSELHRVQAGDTWSVLAERYAGRPSAYRAIAMLNGVPPSQPLQIGQTLVMPVALPYRLAKGDTLRGLAERYLGDPALAEVLEAFNEIEDPRRLSVDQEIEIPLIALRLRGQPATVKAAEPPRPRPSAPVERDEHAERVDPAPPAPKPAPPVTEKKPEPAVVVAKQPAEDPPVPARESKAPVPTAVPQSKFHAEIEQATQAFRRGEFDRARDRVEALRDEVDAEGTPSDRAELLRLQAFVYVAFDLPGQACDAYRALVKLSPGTRLNPQLVSPKIRAALAACPGV